MEQAPNANPVQDVNLSIAFSALPKSESATKTCSLYSALAEAKERIAALSDDDLLQQFNQKLIEYVDRTVELACFVAELKSRGMDLSALEKTRLDRYLAIADGRLSPELYEKFAHTPWLEIFEGYGESLQQRILRGTFEVSNDGDSRRRLTFDEMNANERDQVFASDGPRDISSQKRYALKEPELISGSIVAATNRALRAISAVEKLAHEMDDRTKAAMLEAALNFARTLGFEDHSSGSIRCPDRQQVFEYLELHGTARLRVIAADTGMDPDLIDAILKTGRPFVHKGDGYYSIER